MIKTRINDELTYIQPDSMAGYSACAGLMIESRLKVFIDMNLGPQTTAFLKAEQPGLCMITHYHLDHSTWIRSVKSSINSRVLIHKAEEQYLTSLDYLIENTAEKLGMADTWRDFAVNRLGYAQIEEYECYDVETSFIEEIPGMVAIATFGHSPGHTSFYFPDDKILFSGDMGLDRHGPWYGWSDCVILDIADAILRLDGLEIKLILTSHGGILQERQIRPAWRDSLNHLVQRENKISGLLEKGLSRQQIIDQGIFYPHKGRIKEPLKSILTMWDKSMVQQHIDLIKEGGLKYFFPELKSFE